MAAFEDAAPKAKGPLFVTFGSIWGDFPGHPQQTVVQACMMLCQQGKLVTVFEDKGWVLCLPPDAAQWQPMLEATEAVFADGAEHDLFDVGEALAKTFEVRWLSIQALSAALWFSGRIQRTAPATDAEMTPENVRFRRRAEPG